MDKHILVVGSYNVGLCTAGGRIPAPGETLMAERFFQVAGGKGSNQVLAAARLGAPVRFLARIGSDAFGREAQALYGREGIPLDSVLVDAESHTGVGLVIVDGEGNNAISVAPGANDRLSLADCDAHEALFAGAAFALFQLESPLPTVTHAVAKARAHGVTVVLNPAPAAALDDALLGQVDILTPNEHEAAELTGLACDSLDGAVAAATELRRRGVGKVIVTLGRRGSLLVDDEGSWHCPPCANPALDSTGAGDAYNGALVAELAAGADLRQAIRTATRVAAHCVMYVGVVEGLPTREQLDTVPEPGA